MTEEFGTCRTCDEQHMPAHPEYDTCKQWERLPYNVKLVAAPASQPDLRMLCAEMYQVAGVLGAPEQVLDNLSAAAAGKPLPHKTLLPFHVPASQPVAPANITDMRMCEINRLTLHENQLYRFTAAPGCQKCADYLKPNRATPELAAPHSPLWEIVHEYVGSDSIGDCWAEVAPLLESFRAETLEGERDHISTELAKLVLAKEIDKGSFDFVSAIKLYARGLMSSDPNWLARQIATAKIETAQKIEADFDDEYCQHNDPLVGVIRARRTIGANVAALSDLESELVETDCPYIPRVEDAVAIHPCDLYEMLERLDIETTVDVLKHSDSLYREPIGLWHIKGVWYRQDVSAPRRVFARKNKNRGAS